MDKPNENLSANPENSHQENDDWSSLRNLEMTPPPDEKKNPEATMRDAGPEIDGPNNDAGQEIDGPNNETTGQTEPTVRPGLRWDRSKFGERNLDNNPHDIPEGWKDDTPAGNPDADW